jgi:hypothetical protein
MRAQREHAVTLIIAAIAIIVIVGGYASFTGLAAYDAPLRLDMEKSSFSKGDVFDVNVIVNPVTFMSDESILLYIDNQAMGVVALRQYLDDNGISYGVDVKNLGQNNVEVLNLKDPLSINLADYVSLEYMHPGTTHIMKVEFSRGDAVAEEVFGIE